MDLVGGFAIGYFKYISYVDIILKNLSLDY